MPPLRPPARDCTEIAPRSRRDRAEMSRRDAIAERTFRSRRFWRISAARWTVSASWSDSSRTCAIEMSSRGNRVVIGRQLGHLSSSLCSISVATRAWAYLASLNRLSGILRRSHWREAQRTERLRFKRSYDTQGTACKPPRRGGDAAEMRQIELREG